MTTSPETIQDREFSRKAVDASIRIGLVIIIVAYCFQFIRPFLVPVLWGVIIAVAVYPGYRWLRSSLGERHRLAATLLALVGLALLIVPVFMLGGTFLDNMIALSQGLKEGTLVVPPPPEGVGTWPLIGERLEALWSQASQNLESTLQRFEPQLRVFGSWLLSTGAGTGIVILQFVIAIVIAGVLLASARGGQQAALAVATRLVGERGKTLIDLVGATVRSVAVGILGVALIQALLAGIGLFVVGVPGAGVWVLLVLLLAVVQLPSLLILGPIIVYVFYTASTFTAVVFMIWSIFVSLSDGFLKPLLLGRGVDVPMLVIFVGAIGGFIAQGLIGLFIGAVFLAVGYKLFQTWVDEGRPEQAKGRRGGSHRRQRRRRPNLEGGRVG